MYRDVHGDLYVRTMRGDVVLEDANACHVSGMNEDVAFPVDALELRPLGRVAPARSAAVFRRPRWSRVPCNFIASPYLWSPDGV